MGAIRANIKLIVRAAAMILSLACLPAIGFSTPTPEPVYTIDDLRFDKPITEQRLRELDRCVEEMVDESWTTEPAHLYGNLYELSWCRGETADTGCWINTSNEDTRDQHIIKLGTYFYDFPKVSGLRLHGFLTPASTGWGATFYISESDQVKTYGEGWGVQFHLYTSPDGPPQASVNLGRTLTYESYITRFDLDADTPPREDLKIALSSPEAMRDRGLEHIRGLAQMVETALLAHQVENCDPGEYRGGGIPPPCPPRPLTAEEEAEGLARARAYFAGQEQLLREHYREMYVVWMQTFPLDQCWP